MNDPDSTNTIAISSDIAPDAITSDVTILIARHDTGDYARTASEKLAQVIDHTLRTGKKSKLTLEITAVPHERAESGTPQVVIMATSKTTMPSGNPPQSRMYVHAAPGSTQLLPYDPQQLELLQARQARVTPQTIVTPTVKPEPVRAPNSAQ